MNGINSVRLDVNTTRYDAASSRKRTIPVDELNSATEADKKKQFIKPIDNNLDSNQNNSNTNSELLISDGKYFRANLLNEIVDKMSGNEPRHSPGHIVEYYA